MKTIKSIADIETRADCVALLEEFTLEERSVAMSSARVLVHFNSWAANDDICCYGVSCLAGYNGARNICHGNPDTGGICDEHWAALFLLQNRADKRECYGPSKIPV